MGEVDTDVRMLGKDVIACAAYQDEDDKKQGKQGFFKFG